MNGWVVLGFAAQGCFASRFLLQWLASERAGHSIVPTAFWWLSMCGASMLFVYALYRRDPVFIAGQGFAMLVYIRNLQLTGKRKTTHETTQV